MRIASVDPANSGPRPFGEADPCGLSRAEAAARLVTHGPNEIPRAPAPSTFSRLRIHIREPMNLLLAGAALVSGLLLRDWMEALAIAAIVLLNVGITLVQEARASRSLESLQDLQTPIARVVRDGITKVVPAREVVPDDALVLAAGDLVAADARLIDANGLEVDESMLTGESLPVAKASAIGPSFDPPCAVFKGSIVTTGTGRAIVIRTGGETELGAIAAHLQALQPPSPLQVELARVSARLGMVAVILALGVFGLILLRNGEGSGQGAFLSAVALAVAAVPEGLATIVTVALALGVRRMADGGAIVRSLPAVETLGSTDVIVTDKTGTLTQNRLAVRSILLPSGDVIGPDSLRQWLGYRLLVRAAVLCNDAEPGEVGGDPLERALLDLAEPGEAQRIRESCPRAGGAPFDSKRKLMSTVNMCETGVELFVKGAPEVVVPVCSSAVAGSGVTLLTQEEHAVLLERTARLASQGGRPIALATRRVSSGGSDDLALQGLTLLGIVALRDPVRPEAVAAVKAAHDAGVRLVMVTGDHPGTARAIAHEVGIGGSAEDGNVFARALPEDKVRIVESLREKGSVVAVTGDGVNDVPALRRADIGVAMGLGGTDAAREAADLVITDDDLGTIVRAIREGRGIYDNIQKVIDYLVAANISEVVLVVACLLLAPSLGIPLTPLQILWINLVTDGLPAVALGIDEIDPDVLKRRPRSRRHRLLNADRIRTLIWRGAFLAGGAIGVLVASRYVGNVSWAEARTSMFLALGVSQLAYAWTLVGEGRVKSFRRLNGWLLQGTIVGLVMLVGVIAVPAFRSVFDTVTLDRDGWTLAFVGGVTPPLLIAFGRERARRAKRLGVPRSKDSYLDA